MSDKILLIEDVYDVEPDENFQKPKLGWGGYDGVHIKTEKNDIYFLISNGQNCCEDWGYLCSESEDNYKEFIGAEYRGYNSVETDLVKSIKGDYDYASSGGTMFLNVKTNKGVLQFAVYNFHNGYYGHKVLKFINGEKIQQEYL